MERHVKLFRNGRNQAVRIPREFELPGKEAVIRKQGKRLVIEPSKKKRPPAAKPSPVRPSLAEYLGSLKPIKEKFPQIEDLPAEPVDL